MIIPGYVYAPSSEFFYSYCSIAASIYDHHRRYQKNCDHLS